MADKRFLSIEDLEHLPTPRWRIHSLFDCNSLVQVAGPPASFKTFVALSWALSIATGSEWCGLSVEQGQVLYVLGEGKTGLLKRIQAWCAYHRHDPIKLRNNFRVSFNVPQLANQIDLKDMLRDLELEGFAPDVIIIDTFARSFVGRDENSAVDTGLWIESADKLRQLGYTVIFLHHTRKNTEGGLVERGSTALKGAMDSQFTLQRYHDEPKKLILKCVKQKEHIEPKPMWLERLPICANGDAEGSVIIIPSHAPSEEDRVEAREQLAYEETIIKELLNNSEFVSDRERARALAEKTGLTKIAAQSRISRRRRVINNE